METLILTTGETIKVQSHVDQWASQCTLAELGMAVDDDGSFVCQTPEADEFARRVRLLTLANKAAEAQAVTAYKADPESLPCELRERITSDREAIWNAFCDCTTNDFFRARLAIAGIEVGP